ncbi:MAG: phage integrase N-terminal SAM-like domain-containing protein [Roseovarius sp.]|jgi:integrase|nr:phage integrase N-terminal SAM-like domain-containing protein [Roseovarius sp.]
MAKVKYVTREKDGLYRYNRRVPEDCQKVIRKRLWNLSLGRNYDTAVQRAAELRREHDAIISKLRDPALAGQETVRQATIRTTARIAELERLGAPDAIEGEEGTVEDVLGGMWRRVPAAMISARDDPQEYAQLVMTQALAFGDDSRSGGQTIQLPPPSDPVERMQQAAYRAMIAQRLEQLAPLPDQGKPEMRLSVLMEQYIKRQALRPNTARSYKQMVKRLVRDQGDHPLHHYDRDHLRQHRDTLKSDPNVSAQTVEKHFAPLKALWRWAADEYDELADLQFPRVRLDKRESTIEDLRWQAFNDDEMKRVWQAVTAAWGPDSNSRISPPRRRAFLMAIRVLLYTGLRPVEVFQLKTADVENGILTIRRTKTTPRKLPISKHISDLPDFLAKGGFVRERESKTISVTMSDNFTKVIRAAGLKNDRHVLYSLKDTLVDRLQRQDGMSDDIIRGIIGHVIGQGKLRHYKTPFGETPHGRAAMKKALDAIEYW